MDYTRHLFLAPLLALALALPPAQADEPVTSTVESLFLKKEELNGKQVQIKGKVVKVTNGVMNRNFLHVQDGTGQKGTNDITVTSQQTARIGDEVVVTGHLVSDLDFGAGYTYPLLIEKATIEIAEKATP